MEGEKERNDVQALLQEIRATEVLETRILLLHQLEQSQLSNGFDLAGVAECLTTIWEESICVEVSSCKLNRAVLHVAGKHLQLGNSLDNLSQFLILATKVCMWVRKHLSMEVLSLNEYQEEKHLSFFLQLIVDSWSFSTATFWALTKSPIFVGKMLMLIVENFISEQLKLLKASASEIKRMHSIASDVLKFVQESLDAAVKLCKNYSQNIDWDSAEISNKDHEGSISCEREEKMIHVVNIISYTIENLYELGIIAATGGGSLVTILNLSWKGVVMLLQHPKQILKNKINVANIVISLLSLATESLRCAAQLWVSMTNVSPVVGEVKRVFLPIKFYLINAVRISSMYPCQALRIHKEISLCILKFSTLGLNFCKEIYLKTASEAMTEFLEPTYFLLLHTLLNSVEIECVCKFQFLDWLFPDEGHSCFDSSDEIHGPVTKRKNFVDEIFSTNNEGKTRARTLMLGHVAIFLNLLKSSSDLKEEVVVGVSKKLNFMLDAFVSEDIYSSILGLHIPVLSSAGSMSEVVWQPMLSVVFHALKTFMIVTASSSAWVEIQYFLLCNIVHPHYLCWEIVMELWCFLTRYAEADLINDLIDKLLSLYSITSSSESILSPFSAVRKMAQSLCILSSHATRSTTDQMHQEIFRLEGKRCHVSWVTYLPLLMEGYPLDSLPDVLLKPLVQRILTEFCGFVDNSSRIQEVNLSTSSGSGLLGEPLYALSAALCHQHIKESELGKFMPHILNFTITIVRAFKGCNDSSKKDNYGKLLHEALMIISSMRHAYSSHDMEGFILCLQKLFAMDSTDTDKCLVWIKPALSSFLAGLSHMEITEGEESAVSSAVWELYHVLLRERHWALVHLALVAFGYFAARTSCNQLWRFVPQDAALSFDNDTGKEATEERFMSELKAYLEKEAALLTDSPCEDQLWLLEKEATAIRERFKQEMETDQLASRPTVAEIDDENHVAKKKRKFPKGIGEGMMLLQRGLEIVRDGLERWRAQKDGCAELQDDLSSHLSCLEDVITHLVALEDKG